MGQGRESPDPELTALTFSALSDEAARLLLTEPRRFPVERIVDHAALAAAARWRADAQAALDAPRPRSSVPGTTTSA